MIIFAHKKIDLAIVNTSTMANFIVSTYDLARELRKFKGIIPDDIKHMYGFEVNYCFLHRNDAPVMLCLEKSFHPTSYALIHHLRGIDNLLLSTCFCKKRKFKMRLTEEMVDSLIGYIEKNTIFIPDGAINQSEN
jgi:hypothetical protein